MSQGILDRMPDRIREIVRVMSERMSGRMGKDVTE